MRICLGMISIAPSEFWQMSVIEINEAIEGFREFHSTNEAQPMTKDELKDLMELHPD